MQCLCAANAANASNGNRARFDATDAIDAIDAAEQNEAIDELLTAPPRQEHGQVATGGTATITN